MKVYIGYDEREHKAAGAVCMKTLLDVTRGEIDRSSSASACCDREGC